MQAGFQVRGVVGWSLLVVVAWAASCSPASECEYQCERWRTDCGHEGFFEYGCSEGCPLEAECPEWSACEADCYDCRSDKGLCGEEGDGAIVFGDDDRCEDACNCLGTYDIDDVEKCHAD